MNFLDTTVATLALIVIPAILVVQLWALDRPRRLLRRPLAERRDQPPLGIDPLHAAILLRIRSRAADAWLLDAVARGDLRVGTHGGERVAVPPAGDPVAWSRQLTQDLSDLWQRPVSADDRLLLDPASRRLRAGFSALVTSRHDDLEADRLIHSPRRRRLSIVSALVIGILGMLALGTSNEWWALVLVVGGVGASVAMDHLSAPPTTARGAQTITELLAWRAWLFEHRERLLTGPGIPAELGWLVLFGLADAHSMPSMPSISARHPVAMGEGSGAALPSSSGGIEPSELPEERDPLDLKPLDLEPLDLEPLDLEPLDLGTLTGFGADLGSIGITSGGDGGADGGGGDGGGGD